MATAKNGLPRKKHRILKALGIISAVILILIACVYCFVLQYPQIKTNPKIEK